MTSRTISIDDRLHEYILSHSLREPEVMRRLREETAQMREANMQIAPEQGQFMAFLVEAIGARHCLEIGTFTGYSALAVARALPPGGRLVCCDRSEEYTKVAKRYWREAGVADRIELHLGPALETLDTLLANGQAETYDFAFIDADKGNYSNYYERCLRLVRPGGVLAFDNTLWNGAVADPTDDAADTRAIRALNDALHEDERIALSLVPIGDGVTLARIRG